jgi:hypothetical protein
MSGDGFHVHGPHDHAVEHAAHGNDGFSNNIAVMTAILATVGAAFGYLGGATQNDAALFKNNAAIDKTQAANSWNYYQAKSSKQNLAELAMTLPGVDPKRYETEVARYKSEKEDIKKDAEKWEESSKEWNHKSDESMHQHHQWALDRHLAGRDHPADPQEVDDGPGLRRSGGRHRAGRVCLAARRPDRRAADGRPLRLGNIAQMAWRVIRTSCRSCILLR